MSDNKEMQLKAEQKPVPSSPGLATRMRPKAEDPIEQKLKEVKELEPHFDDMTSYIRTLLKPVNGTTMTKKMVPVQHTSPGKPASPGRASSPGRGSSPAKPTSPAKHSSSAKHSSLAGFSSPTRPSSPTGRSSPARRSSPAGRSSLACNPSPAGHYSSAEQRSTPEPSICDCFSKTALNREPRHPPPPIPLPGFPPIHPFEEHILLPGSPIPVDEIDQVEFMPAIIAPPQRPAELVAIDTDVEVLSTWECAEAEAAAQEVMVLGNGMTMFIRNPDGSYDLYTGLQPPLPEAENPNVREITFNDGPLVILTRDDDGKLTYDPDDTVVIDIADNSLFVLNTEEASHT